MRTFLHMRAREGCEAAFEREWLRAAAEISKVRGNLRQDLLRSTSDARDFTIVSEWADQASLEAFSTGPVRDRLTVALRDLREGAERMTYQVLHSLDGAEPGVRVLLTTTVKPGEEAEFEAAYNEVAEIMRGTPGHVREELLHEPGSTTYHLLAEWTSRTAFLSWVQDPAHQNRTGPLIPYLKRAFSRRIFDIRQRPEESPRAGDATAAGIPAPRAAASSSSSEVLVVGAGPTGLTLAIELARRGVAVRVVDKRPGPNLTADKAIGVHCRTMEIWEDQGIADGAIDRGIWLEGQIVTVNGHQVHRVEWNLPELPYAHLGLPQYETEDLLTRRLQELGGVVETGREVVSLTQDEMGVDVVLSGPSGARETVRAAYVVGCDGAHSVVRKSLGLEFAPGSGRFPQLFMLCDVKVDWDLPPGYLLRFLAMEEGQLRGMLVCVPLRGEGRYRIATMAPPRIMATEAGKDVPPGFMQEFDPPRLEELQMALDRLAPPGTKASDLRWSSIFRISYGIVEKYREGRVLIAGDAAHLHPPAGGQGMNTGIQDAYNLGWKLALTVQGRAAEGLLDSYEAERRPAGKEVVGKAVEAAFTEEVDVEDQKRQFLGEMHMLLSYRDSAWVSQVLDWDLTSGPGPGDRAPDVHGLARRGVGHPLRLFDLTAGTTAHSLLLYVDDTTTAEAYADLERQVAGLTAAYGSELRAVVVASPDAKVSGELPLYVDASGAYREAYSPGGPSAYLVRPDGHVGFRSCPVFPGSLREHLSQILLNTRGER